MKAFQFLMAGAVLCILTAACICLFRRETVVVLAPAEPQTAAQSVTTEAEPSPGPASVEAVPDTAAQDYVLNTRSHKFHLPDCSGLSGMNPENREEFHGTREELLEQGYTPCGLCKP